MHSDATISVINGERVALERRALQAIFQSPMEFPHLLRQLKSASNDEELTLDLKVDWKGTNDK